jgi:hypothetical protein
MKESPEGATMKQPRAAALDLIRPKKEPCKGETAVASRPFRAMTLQTRYPGPLPRAVKFRSIGAPDAGFFGSFFQGIKSRDFLRRDVREAG